MEITYVVIIAVVTYVLGAITKTFISVVPNKFIPLQNLIIGVVSAVICIYTKVEPDVMQAFILCIVSASGAGGMHDLLNKNNYKVNNKPKKKRY